MGGSNYFPHRPAGPATYVGNTNTRTPALSSNAPAGSAGAQYRVVNLANAVQALTWGTAATLTSPSVPVDGAPQQNVVVLAPNEDRVFSGLGPNFLAGSAAGFIVQEGPGE